MKNHIVVVVFKNKIMKIANRYKNSCAYQNRIDEKNKILFVPCHYKKKPEGKNIIKNLFLDYSQRIKNVTTYHQ